jgi:hypothetical protein
MCIDSAILTNPKKYRMSYRVCPQLSYSNKLRGGPIMEAGFAKDDGCSVADDRDGDEETFIESIKRLKLTPELCGGECSEVQVAALYPSLKTLAIETAIAFSKAADGQTRPCRPVDCEDPPDKDPDDKDSPFNCERMSRDFPQATKCGLQ